MFVLRTTTTRAAARIISRQTGCRFVSTTESRNPDPNHHPHPPQEKIGKGFFISVASLVGILVLIKAEIATARTDKSVVTRLIERYTDSQDLWAEKAHRHTAKVEQAGRDKSLFQDSQKSGVIPIRSIENLNTGSPYNNVAGWAGGNMVELRRNLEGKYQV